MICQFCNSDMELIDVETSTARQVGGDIVDATYAQAWYCDSCDTTEDYIDGEEELNDYEGDN